MPALFIFALVAAVAALLGYVVADRVARPLRRTFVTVAWKRHDEPRYDRVSTMYHHMQTQAYDEELFTYERFVACVTFGDDRFVMDVEPSVFAKLREHGTALLSYRTGRLSGRIFPVALDATD